MIDSFMLEICAHTLHANLADETNAAVHSVAGDEMSNLGNVIHALMNDEGTAMRFFFPPFTDGYYYRTGAKFPSISGFLSRSRSSQ